MKVFWLQQTMADVPTNHAWLSASEALRFNGMKIAKRRNDWRLGRWTAKCAIAAYLGWRVESSLLKHIEIRSASSGAPEAFIAGQRATMGVSLSHCAGQAVAAIVPEAVPVGCDLETIEPRLDAFLTDYFTPEEQFFVEKVPAPYRHALITLLWSGKESALKALGQGLRLDTRSVSVKVDDGQGISGDLGTAFTMAGRQQMEQAVGAPGQDGWHALQVCCSSGGQTFHGWWQATNGLVRTFVAGTPLLPPVQLNPQLSL